MKTVRKKRRRTILKLLPFDSDQVQGEKINRVSLIGERMCMKRERRTVQSVDEKTVRCCRRRRRHLSSWRNKGEGEGEKRHRREIWWCSWRCVERRMMCLLRRPHVTTTRVSIVCSRSLSLSQLLYHRLDARWRLSFIRTYISLRHSLSPRAVQSLLKRAHFSFLVLIFSTRNITMAHWTFSIDTIVVSLQVRERRPGSVLGIVECQLPLLLSLWLKHSTGATPFASHSREREREEKWVHQFLTRNNTQKWLQRRIKTSASQRKRAISYFFSMLDQRSCFFP